MQSIIKSKIMTYIDKSAKSVLINKTADTALKPQKNFHDIPLKVNYNEAIVF